MIKNQKTNMRKMIYHNQRHPWRSDMLFMRRNVPASMPDVSANASFCPILFYSERSAHIRTQKKKKRTHHLAKLNGRIADLIPNTNGDLLFKRGSIKIKTQCNRKKGTTDQRTSLSNFTFAPSPSMASSFWPSRSSAKRVPANGLPSVADEGPWYPGYGDERPECGGVGA